MEQGGFFRFFNNLISFRNKKNQSELKFVLQSWIVTFSNFAPYPRKVMSNVNISTHSIFLPTFWLNWIEGRIFTVKNVAQDPDVDNAISFANNKRSSTVPKTCCCRGQRIEIVKTESFWCPLDPIICIIVIRVQQITSHHLCIFTLKTSQELRMLSRSLSDCKSLLLNVMIQVSQFIRNGQLCH